MGCVTGKWDTGKFVGVRDFVGLLFLERLLGRGPMVDVAGDLSSGWGRLGRLSKGDTGVMRSVCWEALVCSVLGWG